MADNRGYILIELLMRGLTTGGLLVVLALIFVQFAIAVPRFAEAREEAIYAAIKQDLEHLAARQAIYFSEAQSYSSALTDLRYDSSRGVTVEIEATPSGWVGTATHAGLETGQGCAVYVGAASAPSAPATPSAPGITACTED